VKTVELDDYVPFTTGRVDGDKTELRIVIEDAIVKTPLEIP